MTDIQFSKECVHCGATEWCKLIGDDWMCEGCYFYLVNECDGNWSDEQ
jgi:hypothetical protein